jgi:hypothetical protein
MSVVLKFIWFVAQELVFSLLVCDIINAGHCKGKIITLEISLCLIGSSLSFF